MPRAGVLVAGVGAAAAVGGHSTAQHPCVLCRVPGVQPLPRTGGCASAQKVVGAATIVCDTCTASFTNVSPPGAKQLQAAIAQQDAAQLASLRDDLQVLQEGGTSFEEDGWPAHLLRTDKRYLDILDDWRVRAREFYGGTPRGALVPRYVPSKELDRLVVPKERCVLGWLVRLRHGLLPPLQAGATAGGRCGGSHHTRVWGAPAAGAGGTGKAQGAWGKLSPGNHLIQ